MKKFKSGFIRPTKKEDFANIEPRLRLSDILEFEGVNYEGLSFISFMTLSLVTTEMITIEKYSTGEVAAILGVNKIRHPKIPGEPEDDRKGGFVWLVGSDLIDKHAFEFARNTREVLKEFEKDYDYLATQAIEFEPKRNRWLTWMGFKEVSRVEARGRLQLPFIQYEKS